jgi:hypothetical protein
MPDPESISLSLDELRAVERHDVVVIARWTCRPADGETPNC